MSDLIVHGLVVPGLCFLALVTGLKQSVPLDLRLQLKVWQNMLYFDISVTVVEGHVIIVSMISHAGSNHMIRPSYISLA